MLTLPTELEIPANFPAPGLYLHQDGGIYRLFGPGIHTQDGTTYCVYQHIWPFETKLWLRPVGMWESRFVPISAERATELMNVPRIQAKMTVTSARQLRKQKELNAK